MHLSKAQLELLETMRNNPQATISCNFRFAPVLSLGNHQDKVLRQPTVSALVRAGFLSRERKGLSTTYKLKSTEEN